MSRILRVKRIQKRYFHHTLQLKKKQYIIQSIYAFYAQYGYGVSSWDVSAFRLGLCQSHLLLCLHELHCLHPPSVARTSATIGYSTWLVHASKISKCMYVLHHGHLWHLWSIYWPLAIYQTSMASGGTAGNVWLNGCTVAVLVLLFLLLKQLLLVCLAEPLHVLHSDLCRDPMTHRMNTWCIANVYYMYVYSLYRSLQPIYLFT